MESWRPLVLQNIEADSTKLVNVWMIDLGSEKDLWSNHWVLVWKEELASEKSTLIWSFSWSGNLDEEMSVVLLVWLGIDSYDWILSESLGFLENSRWDSHLNVF